MNEFGGAQAGDGRLTKRLIKLADRLADAPSASIPGACNSRAETQAAYRLFDQARADKRGLGLPLGILDTWMWARPLDMAESRRWIEGYERVAERAGQLPATRLVYVADREADILELMQRAHALSHRV